MERTTKAQVIRAFEYFVEAFELPKDKMALDFENRRVAILFVPTGEIANGYIYPFYNTVYTYAEMYQLLWFVTRVMDWKSYHAPTNYNG